MQHRWNWTSGLAGGIPEPMFINNMNTLRRGEYLDLDRIFGALSDLGVRAALLTLGSELELFQVRRVGR